MTKNKQPINGSIESLLTSLQKAVEEKQHKAAEEKKHDDEIILIKQALSVRIDEIQQAITMIEGVMTKVPTRKRWEVVLQWKYIIPLWLVSYFVLLLLFPYKNNIPEPVVPNPDSVVLPVVPVPDIPAPPVVIPVVPDVLTMTVQQAKLTQQAIELIREDVLRGSIPTADLAIQALSALLPSSVRQRVLQELGTPDIEYMRDALDILDGKIIIQE